MAEFITRVELHGATEHNYSTLHSAIERAGFSRTIWNGTASYHLPTAEYYLAGNYNTQAVYNAATAAAKSTGRGYWILVSEIVTWQGFLAQV